jgi:ParB family chromosome partitioning protein
MITFQGIVSNIGKVGLKKPITVTRRAPDADGTEYDLGCGEGRLNRPGLKTLPYRNVWP